MKRILIAAALLAGLVSCGSQSTDTENSADSTNTIDANRAPMGDTTGSMMNTNTGSYSMDTSGKGDDSISASSPASRSTTPRNANNSGGGMQ